MDAFFVGYDYEGSLFVLFVTDHFVIFYASDVRDWSFCHFLCIRCTMLSTLSCMFRNHTSLNSEVTLNPYLLVKCVLHFLFISKHQITFIFFLWCFFPQQYIVWTAIARQSFCIISWTIVYWNHAQLLLTCTPVTSMWRCKIITAVFLLFVMNMWMTPCMEKSVRQLFIFEWSVDFNNTFLGLP